MKYKVNIGFKRTNLDRRPTLDRKLSQSGCRRGLVGTMLSCPAPGRISRRALKITKSEHQQDFYLNYLKLFASVGYVFESAASVSRRTIRPEGTFYGIVLRCLGFYYFLQLNCRMTLMVNIGFKRTNSDRRSILDKKLSQSGCRRDLIGSLLAYQTKSQGSSRKRDTKTKYKKYFYGDFLSADVWQKL